MRGNTLKSIFCEGSAAILSETLRRFFRCCDAMISFRYARSSFECCGTGRCAFALRYLLYAQRNGHPVRTSDDCAAGRELFGVPYVEKNDFLIT